MTDERGAPNTTKGIFDRFNEYCTILMAQCEGDEAARVSTEKIIEFAKAILLSGPAGIPLVLSGLVLVLNAVNDKRGAFLFEVINNGFASLSALPGSMLKIDCPPQPPRDDDKTQGTAETPLTSPPSAD